jgi:hypothetical protein
MAHPSAIGARPVREDVRRSDKRRNPNTGYVAEHFVGQRSARLRAISLTDDITGIFSRYFLVGFFLPASFSWLILWATASHSYVPHDFAADTITAKLVTLGVLALLTALALSGLNYSLMRFFEGYPLVTCKDAPLVRAMYCRLLKRQQKRFDRIRGKKENDKMDGMARGRAAWELDRSFPANRTRILPTSFGNAVRAFESHADARYGLDDVVAYPRIEMLMTKTAREPLIEARIDVNVSMNAVIGAILVGIALLVDEAVHRPQPWELSWMYLAPFFLAYLLHLPMTGAAIRWGAEVRAAIDLHRLELYERLGVRTPASPSDERKIATAVSYLLMAGEKLDDSLWQSHTCDRETKSHSGDADTDEA